MKRKNYVRRRSAVLLASYLAAAAVTLGALCFVQYRRAERYELYAANNFSHAFDELVTAVGELDAALQKSVYAVSPAMTAAVCTDIFGKAMTAQMSLGVLPFSTYELERTGGFISRVGDYALALSRSAAAGKDSSGETESLRALSETASVLSQNLKSMQEDMLLGVLSMDELVESVHTLDGGEDESLPATVGGSMRLAEEEFPEIPALIYDGPFSEHLTDSSPAALEGLEEVGESEARTAAAAFLGVPKSRVYLQSMCAGDIPCFYFGCDADGSFSSVAVTKAGGKVMSMLSSMGSAGERLSHEEALQKAKDFLASKGYKDMAETYYMCRDNILTANFAYEQEGVLCYTDLVKVSVALDSGRVCGFEAKGYLSSHRVREIAPPQVDEAKAREKISGELSELSHRLAIVPSAGEYEVLCHEFTCEAADGRKYIIYVDAVDGEQEKILILLEDENGTLTI